MPAEICLEPQRLFESVVGFASGGQFWPPNSPKASEIGLSLEPQQVLRGANGKMPDFGIFGASYSKNFVICIVTKKGGQTYGK